MLEKQMWMKYAPEMVTEWQQMWDEGREVAPFRARCEEIAGQAKTRDCEAEAAALYEQMAASPMRIDYPYREPSDYEGIARELDDPLPGKTPPVTALRGKIAGAWIGRIAGCLLGKPLEGLRTSAIRPILQMTRNDPLNRYIDSREFPEELRGQVDFDALGITNRCWIDRIGDAAPVDDDTNYTVFALKLTETYGRDFRPNDVLEGWLKWIPMFATCTAERVAYRNAACGLLAPQTATRENPYREWIGAQIRGDFFGFINPGNPRAAAEMAWRDGSISHVRNGIYGEMYAAAMIAQAAVSIDCMDIVKAGLREIPESSRLAEAVRRVIAWREAGRPWAYAEREIHTIYDEWNAHHWCHTISNAMIVTAALLYGEGDLGRSICLAVQTGFDTDCNGATVGAIVGMLRGQAAIPAVWADTFHHTLRTSIDGYQRVTIDQLTQKTCELIAEEAGK